MNTALSQPCTEQRLCIQASAALVGVGGPAVVRHGDDVDAFGDHDPHERVVEQLTHHRHRHRPDPGDLTPRPPSAAPRTNAA
ncbi:MAG: hypothetical protein R2690_15605 [Acidimicrobiales bacterium]